MRSRPALFAALGVALAAFLARLPMLHVYRFGHDEIEHLHAAWCISQGMTIYRDFFEVHTPWLYFLLAWPLGWFEVASDAAKAESFMFLARYLVWILTALILWLVWFLGRLWRGPEVAAIAVAFCSLFVMFLEKTLEIRPDVPGLLFWLGGLAACLVGLRREGRGLPGAGLAFSGSGFCLAAGVLCTQKLLFPLPGVALALAWSLLDGRSSGRLRSLVRNRLAMAAGFLVPFVLTAAYFAAKGALSVFLYNAFLLTTGWTRLSPLRYGAELVRSNPVLVSLAAFGAVRLGTRLHQRESLERGDHLLLLATLSHAAGLLVVPAPFPQYYLHMLPLLALIGAATLVDLMERLALGATGGGWRRHGWRLAALAAVLAAGAALAMPRLAAKILLAIAEGRHLSLMLLFGALLLAAALHLRRGRGHWMATALVILAVSLYPAIQMRHVFDEDNGEQLSQIRFVMENSAATDTVLDGWPGLAPFRHHALFHFMLQAEVRALISDAERAAYLEALETGAVSPEFVVFDENVASLSPEISAFVRRRYEPVGMGELWRRRQESPPSSG